MRIFWLPFIIVLLLNIAVDYYIYREMKKSKRLGGELSRLHIVLAAVAHVAIIITLLLPFSDTAEFSATSMGNVMKVIWYYFMFYVPKAIWALFYQLSRPKPLPRWLRITAKSLALILALLALNAMWLGVTSTPYKYEVKQVEISSERLPQAFDGYRIVQISDLHLGTYENDTTFIAECVDAVNALKPDVIMFTGDLVSRTTDEAYSFTGSLSRLKAKDGILSILGNHDYDDYTDMSPEQKREDHEMLCDLIGELGWQLLSNEITMLHQGADSIAVIGTENFSKGHTPNYCKLETTGANISDSTFTILLQHNPQLWREQVLGKSSIDLMLSGHTHAFQIVIPFFGRKISPARLVYREWGGLYSEQDQHLYVNTGIGMVGVPARVGVPPEITLITLKK